MNRQIIKKYKKLCFYKVFVHFSLTFYKKDSIIKLYYFERGDLMLKRYWKKIGMLILIIACVFNVMSKLVNKLSLNKEMLQSAQYIFSEQEEDKN